MSKRIFLIPDCQIPFDSRRDLAAMIKCIGDIQPDEVINVGDTLDFPQPSRWNKGTAGEFEGSVFKDCEDAKRRLLHPLREIFDGPIGFHEGNHDERARTYLSKYAPALAESNAFNIENLLDFDGFGIDLLPDFHKIAPGWMTTHGHKGQISLSRIAGNTAMGAAKRFGTSVVMGHCFDEKTEILTEDGWKTHDELTPETVVLTANKETQSLEWQQVQEIHRYTYFKSLIRIRGYALDLLVTPGHGLVTVDEEGSWSYPTADQAYKRSAVIPLAGIDNSSGLPASDSEIEFLALLMSNGKITPGGCIKLSVSDGILGLVDRVEQILDDLEYQYKMTLRHPAGEYQNGTFRSTNLVQYGGFKTAAGASPAVASLLSTVNRHPAKSLYYMSPAQIHVFLDMYVHARGITSDMWKNSKEPSYFIKEKDKVKLDFLQQLAVRSGRRSMLVDGGIKFQERSTVLIRDWHWSTEAYDGTVWCVSVPNGTLVVRRNGKTAITQNTHRQGIISHTSGYGGNTDKILTGVEVGHLMDQKKAQYLKGGTGNWQKGFAMLTIDGQHVHPDIIPITRGKFTIDGHTWEI